MEGTCHHFAEFDSFTFTANGAILHTEECTLCFAQATVEDGIDLCLHCFNGSCRAVSGHTALHHIKTSHFRFLNVRRRAVEPLAHQTSESPTVEIEYRLRCEECKDDYAVGTGFARLIREIEASPSVAERARIETWNLAVIECRHTRELVAAASPRTAMALPSCCGECEIASNLWLCLTCGAAGCGRAQYGVAEGNSHALQHNKITKHPIAVKLGTLDRADGFAAASCYCYACDEETRVTNLQSVLTRIGIEVKSLRKTEKNLAEANAEANRYLDLSSEFERGVRIEAFAQDEQPAALVNIGNSCYINALLQALFCTRSMAEVVSRGKAHIETCNAFPADCPVCQFSKVAAFLVEKQWRGRVARLFTLRRLIGAGHPEFASERQQDVSEYFVHLRGFLTRAESALQHKLLSAFAFTSVTILTCVECAHFYVREEENLLLTIKFTPAQLERLGTATAENPANFSLSELLIGGLYAGFEHIFCEHCRVTRGFEARRFLRTFPEVLAATVQRLHTGNGPAAKLHFSLRLSETAAFNGLSFAQLSLDRARQMASTAAQYNQETLAQLIEMGFDEESCKRALVQSGNDIEVALSLLVSNTPHLSRDTSEERLERLAPFCNDLDIGMGTLRVALQRHPSLCDEELITLILADRSSFAEASDALSVSYVAAAGIVHLGRDVSSGHYVAYGERTFESGERRWVYFNDERVYKGEAAGLEQAFMLFFEKRA